MLTRAASRDTRAAQVSGGTFHSFAYRWLKQYAKILGLPADFSVLDESDAEEALQRIATYEGIYDRQERAPKKSTLKAMLSMALNKGLSMQEVVTRFYPQFTHFVRDVEKIRVSYAKYKLDKGF